MTPENVQETLEKMMGTSESIQIDIDDPKLAGLLVEIKKARVRLHLSQKMIAVDYSQNGGKIVTIRKITTGKPPAMASAPVEKAAKEPVSAPVPKRHQHAYHPPKIARDLISVLSDDASHVVWLTGPTQCGKDTLVKYIGRELGRKVFQINCRGDMGSEVFFGEKTVTIDPITKQNIITFQTGIVEQAMKEGLDEQGNEVGAPAVLFITEAAAMPPHVAIGINRLLESDDARRTIVVDQDGGRVVRSHSGLRIVLASNTVGRGATGLESAAYSAQTDALDISLLNRVAVFFRMGYDKDVEKKILLEKIGDDRIVNNIIKFRDAIRQAIREGKLTSPFSTAHIIHIADMYRIFGDLGKALYYVVFESILPEERPYYNEQAMPIIGKDLLKEMTQSEIDYMN
jgi:MoxR-like ATPase